MKKLNKSSKGGFGEYTPEGIAKKKLQDKRVEQVANSANNEPKDCGCCWCSNGIEESTDANKIWPRAIYFDPFLLEAT